LIYVFNCCNPEKDLSAEHDVAGIVASIFAALAKWGRVLS